MATLLANAPADPAQPGHNNPPPPTPNEALKDHIDDLAFEAKNFLDGKPIANAEQAAAVSRILDDARKARIAAETQRKVEAKPFDDGKAAVQALWTPLTDEKKGRCALIVETCKQALAPWLLAIEAEQARQAQFLRDEALRLTQVALEAHKGSAGDLQAKEDADRLMKAAVATTKDATKAGKARAQVKGGQRANSLRSVWTPTLTDPCAALKHYREKQGEELKIWLVEQAEKDVRAGARSIPGFTIEEDRVAV